MTILVSSPHFVIFPFLAYGHSIPLLNLIRLLRRRGISVTIFTTPANAPSIRASLGDLLKGLSVIELPFPQGLKNILPGVENTSMLPSMSLFIEFCNATKLLRPSFERALKSLPAISCIISDAFLGWTQEIASQLGVRRLVFSGMSTFATTISTIMVQEKPHASVSSYDEPFPIPHFPHLNITRNDFEEPFCEVEPTGPYYDFVLEQLMYMTKSHGLIVNSFYELEPSFLNYWNNNLGPRAYCVGPLCLAAKSPILSSSEADHLEKKKPYIQWLDSKLAKGESVLYVVFGTQAEILEEQYEEIAKGLEESKVNFLWVVRSAQEDHMDRSFLKGFEDRVGERGLVVKEWVDQMEILKHESVKGFLSHCGWNSVMESICEGVPILAMPIMADQHVNARILVEEIRVGVRVMARNGSIRGRVGWEEVERMVRELMVEERGEEVRNKVKEVREAALAAMEEGGSSWNTLDLLIQEVSGSVSSTNNKMMNGNGKA